MHARCTPATLLLVLCATAGLLLSPPAAAADSPTAGDDKWVVDLSADDAPSAATAAAATPGGGTEYDAIAVADAVVAAPAATAHRFRPRYDSALSPGAKRELEHEARCGPRVPVRRGFPWPEWKPNCGGGGGGGGGGDPKPPAAALLRRPWGEP